MNEKRLEAARVASTSRLGLAPLLSALLFCALPASAQTGSTDRLDCGYMSTDAWMREVRAAVDRGEIRDPALRDLPAIPSSYPGLPTAGAPLPCLTPAQVFAYEDSAGVLLTNFSGGELINLMADAANALMATHGDNFDFVGFWVNFTPHHTIGAAFYLGMENDVQGIGDPTGSGNPIFNNRPGLGLGGNEIEGFVMMWDVNSPTWQEGDGPGADFTRLALAQEFEHRFALFLPPLLDGRIMQGDNAACGRGFHWNWRVDGQGSGMENSEWVGANPANLQCNFVCFNSDTGGVFSYSDLYLMGYVTPAEMDAGNSELRFMDDSNCNPSYFGPISTFDSSDIVASAGPRIPDASTEDQDYRTGWIMIHQPSDLPSGPERSKAVGILEQHQTDWFEGTLGRGTMDNTIFDDCNCNGVPDSVDIANGTSQDGDGNGVPDECECGDLANYCIGAPNSAGAGSSIASTGSVSVTANDFVLSSSGNPPGVLGVFYYGAQQAMLPFGDGFRCVVSGGVGVFRFNPPVMVDPQGDVSFTVDFSQPPADGGSGEISSGSTRYFQFWYRDPNAGGSGFNLSDGLSAVFCP